MPHEEYVEAIRKYYTEEYLRILNVDSVSDKSVREYLKTFDCRSWSHRNRLVRNIQPMKYDLTTDKTNVLTACFKATCNGSSSIYAFLHFTCEKNVITPSFYCTGPTYRSQDGEYRGRYLPWSTFLGLYSDEYRFKNLIKTGEEYIVSRFATGDLDFQVDFFMPVGVTTPPAEYINDGRLAIKLFALCWLCDVWAIDNKIAENHINPAYQNVIYDKISASAFNKMYKDISPALYLVFISRITDFFDDINAEDEITISEIQCGQKIFPLSAVESVKTDDINFNVWREIYITNMGSNLVLNLISPSFSFVNNWFYIQNANAGMFDNKTMHDKFDNSIIAENISSQLKEIDKQNYVDGVSRKHPVSDKFYRLSRNIQRAVVYADSNIRLTDLAVCMTSEFVGRTLRDIPALIIAKNHSYGLDLAFTDTHLFYKHIFEFVYSFYCMNTKVGLIHGDLHMNNATIYRLYVVAAGDVQYVPNPHIAYIMSDKVYLFPHAGLFSMIIDFSRSIVGNYKKMEHEFGHRYTENYFSDQRNRVIQLIYHYFPAIIHKYINRIDALLTHNFSMMFKIISVLDTFVIMNNIRAMFSMDDAFTKGKIKLADSAMKLLSVLIEKSEKIFLTNISKAIEGVIESPDDLEWGNKTILDEVFVDYILDVADAKKKKVNLIEVFNCENDIKYEVEDFDTWGPMLSVDKDLELRKQHGLSTESVNKWIHDKRKDESVEMDALTMRYAQKEKETMQFEKWMTL